MARYQDNSSIKQTCPLINEVIDAIRSVEWAEDMWHTEKQLIDIMEEIRTMNEGLRDWGNDMYNEKEELDTELTESLGKIEDLEEELQSITI